jgi:type I restriction enzyme, S subunit
VNVLPPGWVTLPLEQVAEVQLGKMLDKAKNTGTSRPYLRNVNVRWARFDLADVAQIRMSQAEADKFSIRDGDVLVCEGGEPGRSAVWTAGKTELTYQKALHRVRVTAALNPWLLSRQLHLDALNGTLARQFTGSTIKHLPQVALQRYQVLVPPPAEQQRIADKLDTVLARVDACRDRLARVAPLLKRFRQSVLEAATSGLLTQDWRANGSGNEPWREVVLSDIADVIGGVTKDAKKQSMEDEEVPYLRVANVQRGYLDLNEVKTIRVPAARLAGLLLRRGDILFNEGGDLDKLGRGWIWEEQIGRCSFQNHVFRARLHDVANEPKYISWWGNSKGLRYFISSGKQTTNLASINRTMLCGLPISLPPPREQTEIVRRVETLFAFADRLEARLTRAQTAVDRLTPSLLAKAFRGELVPQDPADEPAAELLKRLAQSRPAATPKTRKPRQGQPA